MTAMVVDSEIMFDLLTAFSIVKFRKKDPSKLKEKIFQHGEKNQSKKTWQRVSPDFQLLNDNERIFEMFQKSPEDSLFVGFLTNIISHVWNYKVTLWQRVNDVLLSLTTGNTKNKEAVHILLLPSNSHLQCCILEREDS